MEKTGLFKAFILFQGQITAVEKNKTAGMGKFSFKYADLATIWEMIRQPLASNGLFLSQLIINKDGKNYLKTVLGHESGEVLESEVLIEAQVTDVKLFGALITYYRRYSLSSMLGIVSDDDMDDVPPIKKEIKKLDSQQIFELNRLLNGNTELRGKMLRWAGALEIEDIQESFYEKIISTIEKYNNKN